MLEQLLAPSIEIIIHIFRVNAAILYVIIEEYTQIYHDRSVVILFGTGSIQKYELFHQMINLDEYLWRLSLTLILKRQTKNMKFIIRDITLFF